ncbi:MAG: hypothetical protein GX811_09965, partial [Lentisphaerae bacterium]|nr:hypothetical protein [Lentisphaerota bacterium]
VHVSLIKDDSEFLACNLPLDCIDSETAPYLLVWLFEWCEIHESHWNNSAFSGKFQAFDRARMGVYELSCSLQKTDLSEGLYKLELELGFTREESG